MGNNCLASLKTPPGVVLVANVPPPLSGGKGVISQQYCFNIGLYSPFLAAETLRERAAGKEITQQYSCPTYPPKLSVLAWGVMGPHELFNHKKNC